MAKWFTIFTTSKFECSWCVKAKELLQVYGIDYFEKDIHTNEDWKQEFIEHGFKTVPQIYDEGYHVGGYEKLKEYLRETTKGARDEKLAERLTKI